MGSEILAIGDKLNCARRARQKYMYGKIQRAADIRTSIYRATQTCNKHSWALPSGAHSLVAPVSPVAGHWSHRNWH